MSKKGALREIVESLRLMPKPTRDDIGRLKMRIAGKRQLGNVPSNSEIMSVLKPEEMASLVPLLRRKTTRTISGVAIVAVMTKPYPCPQLKPCAYCPGGPTFGVPQSYTGFEPAAMRGLQNKFNPYKQVMSRIDQLQAIGHKVDKIELIIMGGTFPATPTKYQTRFIQRCLDAITGKKSPDLKNAKKNAETSRIRNVGITVETRPDWAKEAQVDRMLDMGVTRVEMGVQNPSNGIYSLVGRMHTVQDVVDATRIMKDAGLKIAYHLMPGLPGSNPGKDLSMFKRIFADANYKPDMIKIYPCLVLKGTKTHAWYLEGKYKPYTTQEATNLIVEIKKTVPPWVRIMRVQRDIPSPLIVAGVERSNLRQLVQQRLNELGVRCRCIRCREVGHRIAVDEEEPNLDAAEVRTTRYTASEGEEVFISAEVLKDDVLVGYVRLRIPSERAHRSEVILEHCSIVRELHVYGPLVPVGKRQTRAWQHKGYGRILLSEAERVAREEYDLRKILVISALGTKQYYKRLGYRYEGVYMSKMLGD